MNKHLQRAHVLLQLSRYAQAEKEVRKAIVQEPDSDFAHRILALSLINQADLGTKSVKAKRFRFWPLVKSRPSRDLDLGHEAVREAQHAVHIDPQEPYNHYVLAIVLAGMDDLHASGNALAEAIRLTPRQADFHAFQAFLCHKSKQWPRMLAAADECLKLDPQHKLALGRKAVAMLNLGQARQAAEVAAHALTIHPNDSYIHEVKALADLHKGRPHQAIDHLREALRVDPESQSSKANLAFAWKVASPKYVHAGKGKYIVQKAKSSWPLGLLFFIIIRIILGANSCSDHHASPPYSPSGWPQNRPADYDDMRKILQKYDQRNSPPGNPTNSSAPVTPEEFMKDFLKRHLPPSGNPTSSPSPTAP